MRDIKIGSVEEFQGQVSSSVVQYKLVHDNFVSLSPGTSCYYHFDRTQQYRVCNQ